MRMLGFDAATWLAWVLPAFSALKKSSVTAGQDHNVITPQCHPSSERFFERIPIPIPSE
jgi:hypothetical protein